MRKSLLAASLFLIVLCPTTALAAIEVSGTLNGNNVWTKANNPYIIEGTGITIPLGSTLTIEPGTIVKMRGVFFAYIYGTLLAEGTAIDPIIITSIHDDTAGGDTNENGALTVPTQGDWLTLYFLDGSRGAFTNTDIRYGGRSNGPSNPTGQIWNQGGDITIADSRIANAQNFNILQNNGTTTVTDSIILRAMDGVRSTGGSVSSIRNTFVDNGRPLFVSGGTLTLESNNFGTTGFTPFVDASVILTNHGGNIGKGLAIKGTIAGSVTWPKDSMPYVITDTVTVPVGVSLTIEPGTVVKMEGFFFFYIYGTLTAEGTALDPITITSLRDDTVGGDTNGDGALTTPTPGDWLAFYFLDESHGSLVNVNMRYGGHSNGPTMPLGQIQNQGGIISIASSTLSDSANFNTNQSSGTTTVTNSTMARAIDGIHFTGGTIVSTGNSFVDNIRPLFASQGTLALRANNFGTTGTPSFVDASVAFQNQGDNVGGKGFAVKGTIRGHATWRKDSQPYLITNTLTIPIGTSLSILSGAVVKMDGVFFVYIYGMLKAGTGTATDSVVITSLHDDTVGGDTSGDGALTTPTQGDWLALYFLSGSQGTFSNVQMRYGGRSNGPTNPVGQIWNQGGDITIAESRLTDAQNFNILQSSGTTTITESTLTRSRAGIFVSGGTLTVHDSSIHGNAEYGVRNMTLETLDATQNWWGNPGGPTHASNPFGAGDRVSGNVDFGNWLTEEPGALCITNCNSNVLFLPGIMGSTLYRYDHANGVGTKVWEPSLGGTGTEQVEQLHMNPELATSNNLDIYAKEILREDWSGSNYYKTFAEKMDSISGEGMSINEWAGVPYDWRLAPDKIIASGKKDGMYISYLKPTLTPYIIQELKRLAASSKTGKVTIVAHSYGGLVTKALIDALGTTTTQALIDDIVFVAVPQVGTPQAIAGMLYGKNQDLGFGLAVTEEEAQSFAATLPMAYTLLPSRGYFTSVHEQVVRLPADDRFAPWRALYGNLIGNWDELHSFLTTASDRELLQNLLVSSGIPPTLNHTAHLRALATHNVADTWIPPDGISLTQIAGWGIPKTVKGITFKGKPNVYCTATDTICQVTRSWSLIPGYDTTMDGDGTVVTPSALWTSASVGAVNYWVNLKKYGRSNFLTTINREHGDILEVPELTNFITDILTQSTKPLADYTYLSTMVPTDTSPRLRYSLHSPLTLDLYDDHGRHTGVSTTTGQIETQIPGTYFSQIGEVKYLFTDASSTGHIIMDGYATGTFTFAVEELQGDILLASTTWKDIPTTPNTRVTVSIESDITTISPMQIDRDGNGAIDFSLPPQLNSVVTMPKPALTITANSQTVLLGSQLPLLTATMSGFVDGDVASTSIMGVSQCTTTATSTSRVGTYSIHCTIGTLSSETYEFTTFVAGTLKVLYRFNGFTQPINDTVYNPTQSLSVFKGGSTVPVKFQIKNVSGTAVQSSAAPIWLTPQKLSSMSASIGESAYSDPASSGSTFKWDSTSQQYIYNWSTKGLAAGYWYRLSAKLEDGILYTVMVGVR